ncbi:MAG: thymidylate synthase [Defluviitaleaceae bacterium]|nr:thymidylate synthase [Defluviitaleaceae bacterium]
MQIINKLEIATRQELRNWLIENHDKLAQAWVPVLSKDPDELSYLAIVEECLCFGWIDSTKKRLGRSPDGELLDHATGTNDVMYQRISPRRKSGNWTELNKERVRRLARLGLMHPQGEKILPDMDENNFAIRQDVMDAIKADLTTYENFTKLPALYIRIRIDNIQSHPQGDDTYNRRLEKFLINTKENKLYGDWNDGGRLL